MEAPTGSISTYHDKLIIAHAVFASLAALFVVPSAILMARYLRGSPSWYRLHSGLNLVTAIFIIIVFALGTRAVGSGGHGSQFSGTGADTHHQLGLAVFLIVMVQTILGLAAHYTKTNTNTDATFARGKSVFRYVHIVLGIATAALLYVQVYDGFYEWDMTSDAGTLTPMGIKDAYWVLLALAVGAYLAGWLLEFRRKREQSGSEMKQITTP